MRNQEEKAGNLLPKVFTFNPSNAPIRVQVINQNPYFIAKDVCEALDLKDTEASLRKLEDDEKLMRKLYVSGQNRDVWLVNESGLYNLIFRSNKQEAKTFRKWVTGEVLPELRKTGEYRINTLNRPRATRGELINSEILNLLWLIGESLHRGDQKQVAFELGVSVQSINRVLNGYQRSNRILSALYKRAQNNRESFMLYTNPSEMTRRLLEKSEPFTEPHLPSVSFGKRGAPLGSHNARKQKGVNHGN